MKHVVVCTLFLEIFNSNPKPTKEFSVWRSKKKIELENQKSNEISRFSYFVFCDPEPPNYAHDMFRVAVSIDLV